MVNKINKQRVILFLIGLLLGACLFLTFKKNKVVYISKTKKEFIIDTLVKVDSTRVKTILKFRKIKETINIHDTIQVVNAINTCDTIIKIDSVEISLLKKVIKFDSLTIDSLKKNNKKYLKGLKHGAIIGSISTAIIFSAIK